MNERRNSILDMAEEVLSMQNEIDNLRADRDHFKRLFEMASKSNDMHAEHTRQNISSLVEAVLDPDSVINLGIRAKEARRAPTVQTGVR